MTIGTLKEPSFESRVSIIPEHIAILVKMGASVVVETGAGDKSYNTDTDYTTAGAKVATRNEVLAQADIILSIHPPTEAEVDGLRSKVLLGFYQPLYNAGTIQQWANLEVSTFSMDMLPRTTRAQSMDVLSSQANIAGYKAVLLAANMFPKYFPMFMTAAGSIPPAKMLILGAGVAGLQAIATGKRLGAIVEVFDTRPAVKEEVMSLGGKFVEVEGAADASKAGGYAVEQSEAFLEKQKAKIAERVAKSDIIICTAQIPGKKAPILITDEMLGQMKNGSVVIDLAAATGGNTSQTKNDETYVYHGVTIIGNSNLPGSIPSDASKMYSKNICNFLQLIVNKEGALYFNFDDEIVAGTCITHHGKITNERINALL